MRHTSYVRFILAMINTIPQQQKQTFRICYERMPTRVQCWR
jgi:hypothetical protein